METKYGDKAKLCYKDTDSFLVHSKFEEVFADPAGDVNRRFDTSNYEVQRSLPIKKDKTMIGLMKNKLCKRIMKELVALRPKLSDI